MTTEGQNVRGSSPPTFQSASSLAQKSMSFQGASLWHLIDNTAPTMISTMQIVTFICLNEELQIPQLANPIIDHRQPDYGVLAF